METNNRPCGWTTIEEVNELLDAGLSPETADMAYEINPYTGVYRAVVDNYIVPRRVSNEFRDILPCWSFGRLMELLPTFTLISTTGRVQFVYNRNGEYLKDICGDTPIAALVKTIPWMLKEGHITPAGWAFLQDTGLNEVDFDINIQGNTITCTMKGE